MSYSSFTVEVAEGAGVVLAGITDGYASSPSGYPVTLENSLEDFDYWCVLGGYADEVHSAGNNGNPSPELP